MQIREHCPVNYRYPKTYAEHFPGGWGLSPGRILFVDKLFLNLKLLAANSRSLNMRYEHRQI